MIFSRTDRQNFLRNSLKLAQIICLTAMNYLESLRKIDQLDLEIIDFRRTNGMEIPNREKLHRGYHYTTLLYKSLTLIPISNLFHHPKV